MEPCTGKRGDAEAGGDIFIAQQRIGGDPAAQLAGELHGLLDAGFRHEDDELVAAVTRDDIGAAAILLENVADALQHDVAFEVAVEIVHEFEAVEVHEDEREGAVGARGALPFRRERFHQEAVRLDAGEAVGDGLLLSLLESDAHCAARPRINRRGCAAGGFLRRRIRKALRIRRTERRAD